VWSPASHQHAQAHTSTSLMPLYVW
jgi:hypothetical protein